MNATNPDILVREIHHFPRPSHSLSMNCGIETPASNKQYGGLEARLLRPYN